MEQRLYPVIDKQLAQKEGTKSEQELAEPCCEEKALGCDCDQDGGDHF